MRYVLRASVIEILRLSGFQSTEPSALELLTDCLERYLRELALATRAGTELSSRCISNVDDVALAFKTFDVTVEDLFLQLDWIDEVDLPFQTPLPVPPGTICSGCPSLDLACLLAAAAAVAGASAGAVDFFFVKWSLQVDESVKVNYEFFEFLNWISIKWPQDCNYCYYCCCYCCCCCAAGVPLLTQRVFSGIYFFHLVHEL